MGSLNKDIKILNEILHNIRLKDVATKPAVVVKVEEDFCVIEEIFVKKKIRHLPVVNAENEIIGIISQRDVYRHIAPRRSLRGEIVYRENIIVDGDGYYEKESLNQYILNYVMHKNPKVLTEEHSLGDAIHIMVTEKIGCVPVIDANKHVLGIITRIDVLKLVNDKGDGC